MRNGLVQFYEMVKFLGISVVIFLKEAELFVNTWDKVPPKMKRTRHFSGLTAIHRTENFTVLSNTTPFYATRERTNDWSSMFYVSVTFPR